MATSIGRDDSTPGGVRHLDRALHREICSWDSLFACKNVSGMFASNHCKSSLANSVPSEFAIAITSTKLVTDIWVEGFGATFLSMNCLEHFSKLVAPWNKTGNVGFLQVLLSDSLSAVQALQRCDFHTSPLKLILKKKNAVSLETSKPPLSAFILWLKEVQMTRSTRNKQ